MVAPAAAYTRCAVRPEGEPETRSVTELLKLWRKGDAEAHSVLMEKVYPELKRIAGKHMARERQGHTLIPTALVNEAYLRLRGQKRADWKSRSHFLAVASFEMRRILIEHARARLARKRQAILVPMDGVGPRDSGIDVDVLALEDALRKLEATFPFESQVVQLRFFGGLTIEETAVHLEVSHATVERAWAFAKAWLYRRVSGARPTA